MPYRPGKIRLVLTPALLGIFQNEPATIVAGGSPLLDLIQGSKTSETGVVIVETADSHARGLHSVVDFLH